ncbi:MAG: methyltransferase domain-containing protein [Treponema sp.]|nr:methyltransferase domain-containing protein [Treponema sp.]
MDSSRFTIEKYKKDEIRAVDAKFEAQKIAFSPLTFQAVRALINLNLLQAVNDAGTEGITVHDLAEKCKVSEYGVRVLSEMALGMNVLKMISDFGSSKPDAERLVLGKIGWFLLEDDMTKVNFNFTNDICYKGAYDLAESVKNGKPEGLKFFGDHWTTIYEALSSLPVEAKKSWFEFDHFYSDRAFTEALPIVFSKKISRLMDIGGNTAKWAIACCRYNPAVSVTIVDLPGQTAVAEENARLAGFSDRIDTCSGNILDEKTRLPDHYNAIWMSQFLDCFSLKQVTKILTKIYDYVETDTDIYVLEPLWNKQRFEASSYSLQATSLYFTCMANGNSKMYRYEELTQAIEKAGFELKCAHHNLGANSYSLLVFKRKK